MSEHQIPSKDKRVLYIANINVVVMCLLVLFIIVLIAYGNDIGKVLGYTPELNQTVHNSKCNVQVITLNGLLDTSDVTYRDGTKADITSTKVLTQLSEAEQEPQIKAVLLSVDSGGGAPVAGAEIASALAESSKPTVAWIRSVGASAAYWAISSAGRIFASESSAVGSIGVTRSYMDYSKRDARDGLSFQSIAVGKYKDTGNPDKPLSDDERAMLLKGAESVYDDFVQQVSVYRKLDVKKVKALADGSVYMGSDAKERGLIDEVATYQDIQKYVRTTIKAEPVLCWK